MTYPYGGEGGSRGESQGVYPGQNGQVWQQPPAARQYGGHEIPPGLVDFQIPQGYELRRRAPKTRRRILTASVAALAVGLVGTGLYIGVRSVRESVDGAWEAVHDYLPSLSGGSGKNELSADLFSIEPHVKDCRVGAYYDNLSATAAPVYAAGVEPLRIEGTLFSVQVRPNHSAIASIKQDNPNAKASEIANVSQDFCFGEGGVQVKAGSGKTKTPTQVILNLDEVSADAHINDRTTVVTNHDSMLLTLANTGGNRVRIPLKAGCETVGKLSEQVATKCKFIDAASAFQEEQKGEFRSAVMMGIEKELAQKGSKTAWPEAIEYIEDSYRDDVRQQVENATGDPQKANEAASKMLEFVYMKHGVVVDRTTIPDFEKNSDGIPYDNDERLREHMVNQVVGEPVRIEWSSVNFEQRLNK